MANDALDLFGGVSAWSAGDWTASDDRVRAGQSRSYFDCADRQSGRFYGTLDVQTLGGAGFAAQRTTGDGRQWDLSEYAGITLGIVQGDHDKCYTFILKDTLPARRADGRDEATISYEMDFRVPPDPAPGDSRLRSVSLPFEHFVPTYRGKILKDAPPLNLRQVRRISLMMRSHFGAQQGDFSLSLRSITAVSTIPA